MSWTIKICLLGSLASVCWTAPTLAGERPTLKVTCDPRPDILPRPIYDAHVEYRRQYNRPTYLGGWLANVIEPSSQEAMVWCENVRAGRYDQKHMPPIYKRYFAPKPWEVLQTGSRPDFARNNAPPSRAEAASPSDVEPPTMGYESSSSARGMSLDNSSRIDPAGSVPPPVREVIQDPTEL